MKILLLLAMNAEAQPIIESLCLTKSEGLAGFPYQIYSGRIEEKHEATLMASGIDSEFGVDNTGIVDAAAMLAVALVTFGKPDVVINAGTGGGFGTAGSKIGDVYFGEDYVYHDHRIPIEATEWPKKGIGGYQMKMPDTLKSLFPVATVTTGNSLDITDKERRIMGELAKTAPIVKEMEATVFAQICARAGIPLISLKSITDVIDGGEITATEFLRNLKIASQRLQQALSKLLSNLSPEAVREIRPGRNPELVERILKISRKETADKNIEIQKRKCYVKSI